jgi:hypothetical protein
MGANWNELNHFGSQSFQLRGADFYISYNPNPFASDDGGPETALCKDGEYYILNGDFRETYEHLILQGFDACKGFYDQQSAFADSSWSSHDKARA